LLKLFQKSKGMVELIIGILGLLFTILNNVPQVIHTLQTKKVDDFNAISILLRLLCHTLWLVYGIALRNPLFITSSVLALCNASTIAAFKVING
jgi:uncharacterized protein with PQ loop repeat